ncbi:MAG: S9 family peptidase [Verrucomicrobia bacterium]|nr:S9 family peptidase [Verrucomicrobiota bacterium]
MRIIVLLALFSMTNLSQAASSSPLPPQIPLRDFFRNPEIAGFQLSPSGNDLAYVRPYESRLNVFIRPREGGEEKRLTSVTDRDVTAYFWKGDQYILFLKDNGGDENFHLFAVDRDGKQVRDLTPFEGARAELIDDLEDHPTDVIVALNKRNKEVFDAYRLNVETGDMKLIAENPGNIANWVTDHDGRIRVATTTDGVNTSLLYRKSEQEAWKTILTTNFKESFSPAFFTFDNKNLYGVSNLGRDKAAVVEFDLDSAKETQVLYENPEVDVSDLTYSRKRKVLTSAVYTTWRTERKFFDREAEGIFSRLEAKLPGMELSVTSASKDEDRFVVRTMSDRSLGAFYLYDVKGDELTKLADRAPWLNPADLAEMKPISYQARDGLTINGYLSLPKGAEPKNLPVIINVHGGPWARDAWGFDPEVQFLANRGYAILQVNYRGSTGYGRKFWEISFKQWGGTMQDDITDGAEWLIKEGIANPKRIAIYGGSYGGYATLEGLVKTPDLYAAGVDYVGVSNLFTFLKTIPPYWKPQLDMMYAMVGNPDQDKEWFRQHSPALNADRIKAPLFVAQGAKDPRVNIAESNQIVEALKKRGVDVEYMVKENEGHGFHNEENRFSFYEAMEQFLSKHVPVDAAKVDAAKARPPEPADRNG